MITAVKVSLRSVTDKAVPNDVNDVEWLRVQRNRPELYRYFRQDKPISPKEQLQWWTNRPKLRMDLYIVEAEGKRVGYVGFNPINRYARNAEFGIFIIPEEQGNDHGKEALLQLLRIGFEDKNLANIYSDVINYEGEKRFDFYAALGFEAYPAGQTRLYKKQGKIVPSIKFYITKEMWEKRKHGQESAVKMAAQSVVHRRKRGRPRKARPGVPSGAD